MQAVDIAHGVVAAPWHEAIGVGFVAFGCAGLVSGLLAIVFARSIIQTRKDLARRRRAQRAANFLDVEFLDGLASAAPPARIAALLKAMMEDCRNRIGDIRDAAKAGDLFRLQEESAALAESCEAFGAEALAAEARALIVAVRDQAFDQAARTLLEIDTVAQLTFGSLSDRIAVGGR